MSLPGIPAPHEMIDSAFSRARKRSIRRSARAGVSRQIAVSKIESVSTYLIRRLNLYVKAYSSIPRTPFILEMVRIALDVDGDIDPLAPHLQRIRGAVRICRSLKKRHIATILGSPAQEASRIRKMFYGRVNSLIMGLNGPLAALRAVRRALTALPGIDPDTPVIVIAGFPNVGKSSLVRCVSSGRPVVASYPFTTKGIHLGHANTHGLTLQFMDTPGLLDRSDRERNPIERRAVAALRHLATLIIFLIDPTGESGDLEDQTHLLASLTRTFPDTPVIPVFSKRDRVDEMPDLPGVVLAVSSVTRAGVDRLLQEVVERVRTSPPGADQDTHRPHGHAPDPPHTG